MSAIDRTPDFDTYPNEHKLQSAYAVTGGVQVVWDDGLVADYQRYWLRENAPDPETTHPETREQALQLLSLPEELQAVQATIDEQGCLVVVWSTSDTSVFDPGWLRAWTSHAPENLFALPARQLWQAHQVQPVPRFDGPRALAEPTYFDQWCEAIHVNGVAILERLPQTPHTLEEVVSQIGSIRPTNFGRLFDVRTAQGATSNAYTEMALPLHSDLCTREYMPGLQFLHCVENSVNGGASSLSDGFAVAHKLQAEDPEAFALLSSQPMTFYNKAADTDFRMSKPMITLNGCGEIEEIRLSPWLRAPLPGPLPEVEALYRALRLFLSTSQRAEFVCSQKLQAGDVLGFDNRRILHGREAYDPSSGERWLRGCYLEREDLHSRLRMAARRLRST